MPRTPNRLELFFSIIIAVVFIGTIAGIPQSVLDLIVKLIVSMMVSSLLSLIAGTVVEAVTGDLLKTISLTVEVKGFGFSISLFIIATLVLKIIIFR